MQGVQWQWQGHCKRNLGSGLDSSQLQIPKLDALIVLQLLRVPEYALQCLLWLMLAHISSELSTYPQMNTFRVVH